jgi:hypothetical protein
MIPLYNEIFDEFKNASTKAERIEVLKKHGNERFQDFLLMWFSDKYEFDTPIPTYKPSVEPEGMSFCTIHMEVPKLYRFVKNHPRSKNLKMDRKIKLLTIVLESLHPKEAQILKNLILGHLDVPFLTKKLVKETFYELKALL